jgi:hypothetical protein
MVIIRKEDDTQFGVERSLLINVITEMSGLSHERIE